MSALRLLSPSHDALENTAKPGLAIQLITPFPRDQVITRLFSLDDVRAEALADWVLTMHGRRGYSETDSREL
jgi:hypothetical protein